MAPSQPLRLRTRPAVSEMLDELNETDEIIPTLVYVVMPLDNAFSAVRYNAIIQECESLGFVAIHLREIAPFVPDPLDSLHDLIGQANLVVFDLSRADSDVTYQLGYQRALGDISEDGVLLFTDDASTPVLSYAPFRIKPILSDGDLQEQLRSRLKMLRTEIKR